MRVRVKICGLRDAVGIDAAVAAGADAVGIVLEPRSPRAVPLAAAAPLLERVPHGIRKVAVFVRPDDRALAAVAELGFDAVQAFAPYAPPADIPLGFVPAVTDGPDLHARAEAARHTARGAGFVLVDGPRGGGRGEKADPDRVAALAWRVPVVLAGGLTPDDVAASIAHVRPVGVDVSSGVESAPGIKDPARIAAFLAAVRSLEGAPAR